MSGLLSKVSKKLRLDTQYLFHSGSWSTFQFMSDAVIGFITQVVITYLLSKEMFGQYQYFFALVGMVGAFSVQGFRVALIQMISKGEYGGVRYAIKFQFLWSLLLSLGLVGVGLYYHSIGESEFSTLLFLGALFYPVTNSLTFYQNYLQGQKKFQLVAIYSVLTNLLVSVGVISAVVLTKNLFFIILASLLLKFLFNLFFFFKVMKNLPAGTPSGKKEMLKFGGHLSILNTLGSLVLYLDKVLINFFVGPIGVAQLSIATVFANLVRNFIKSTSQILLPQMSSKSLKELKKGLKIRIAQTVSLGLLSSVLFYFLTPLLIKVFYSKYTEVIWLAQLLAFEAFFLFLGAYLGQLLKSQQLIRPLYHITTWNGVLRIFGYLIMGHYFQLEGIIYARLFTNFTSVATTLVILNRELKHKA